MQLPDESIDYQYQRLLVPPVDAWTPLAELQATHFLSPDKLADLRKAVEAVRGRVAGERDLPSSAQREQPLHGGFVDLPQKLLDAFRRQGDTSDLGKVIKTAARLREGCDRVILLGTGGSSLGAKALFGALCHTYHNELPGKQRLGTPRMYFAGDDLDNDALAELLELLEVTCVEREVRGERWGVIVASKSGATLETAVAYRALRAEAARYYGPKSPDLKKVIVPITGPSGRLRDMVKADGYAPEDILTIPDDVGRRFSVFTPAGLLPAAVLGLDVRAFLIGAAAMTRRFLEDPFERNPVLQFAAVNYLLSEGLGKRTRVLAVWSRKLAAVGGWYEHLVSESLGKLSRGPTPLTTVMPRDIHTRGQQLQEGTRDNVTTNLFVRSEKHPPVAVGMSDRNEDDLNAISRKGVPDLLAASHRAAAAAHYETARPEADLVLPTLSEHTMGQLMQMLMLATVVEGRLMGINPYARPGLESYHRYLKATLLAEPNLPKSGEHAAARPAG